jgi:hypothetical protein
MIAAIYGPDRTRMISIQRTWLWIRPDGMVDKAPVPREHQKMALGDFAGGVIPLLNGPSGRPWSDPAPNETAALAEGVENALSTEMLRRPWRTLCAGGLSAMLGTVLPARITEVAIVRDNDEPGSDADKLLPQVKRHFEEMGKRVRVYRLRDRSIKDINDLVQRRRQRLSSLKTGGS